MESSEEEAVEAVCDGINQALERVKNKVTLLLENTAGQGSEIGYSFEQIKKIIDGVEQKKRMGVYLDTAHTFEAGYDLSNKAGLERTLELFDKAVGLKRLHLLHMLMIQRPHSGQEETATGTSAKAILDLQAFAIS
jgi:deoxyribonuclease-4